MNAQRQTNRDEHSGGHLLDLVGRLAGWVAWLLCALAFWAVGTGMANTVVVESGMRTLSVEDIEPLADVLSPTNKMQSAGIRSGHL